MLVLTIYGILANIALVVTVLGSKEMRANPSYYLLIQMALCDLVLLLFEVFYHQAGIVFRQAYLGSAYSPLNFILHFIFQCAWWTWVCALTLTAFNRFVCIVFVGRYNTLFTRSSTLTAILINYVLGIAISVPSLFPCCRVLWFFDEWATFYYPGSSWYIQFDFIFTLTTIGIIIICYLGVFLRASGKNGHGELRIALQVGLICGIYIINSVMWNLVQYFAAGKWTNAAVNSTTSLQCGMHPTIAFLFNSNIRKELFVAMNKSRRESRVAIVSTSSNTTTTSTSNLVAARRI